MQRLVVLLLVWLGDPNTNAAPDAAKPRPPTSRRPWAKPRPQQPNSSEQSNSCCIERAVFRNQPVAELVAQKLHLLPTQSIWRATMRGRAANPTGTER